MKSLSVRQLLLIPERIRIFALELNEIIVLPGNDIGINI